MSSPRVFFLVLFLLLHLVPLTKSATQEDYFCDYEDDFLPGSDYETNLNTLLDHLVSATIGPPFDVVIYAVGDPPDRVYGKATCDYSAISCYYCLTDTRNELISVCAYKKGGQADPFNCSISYDEVDIYGLPTSSPPPPPPPPPDESSPPPPDESSPPPPYESSPPPPFRVLPSSPLANPTHGAGGGTPSYGSNPTSNTERTSMSPPSSGVEATKLVLYVSLPLGAGLIVLSVLVFLLWRRGQGPQNNGVGPGGVNILPSPPIDGRGEQEVNILPPPPINERRQQEVDAPPPVNPTGINTSLLAEIGTADAISYNFQVITRATDNFSSNNFLGEGGCGPVYKGVLPSGQTIAVKRLSGRSVTGRRQLKNEIVLVSKLQHRNLARILGYCFEKNEALIMYEYFPNTSLDKFLFDPAMSQRLDWQTRFNIIKGVARGLTYLHEDSRDKIVHRDMKASNVLLDADMNPRISDFGIAKHFQRNQTHAQTILVIGTSAYMAPEYDNHGEYSPKSDVYSFGVLVLEIITGRRYPASHGSPELIRYVLDHWWGKTTRKVLDGRAGGGYDEDEMMRCINIGLLCVQVEATKRPVMSWVVAMLASGSVTPLPPPPLRQ